MSNIDLKEILLEEFLKSYDPPVSQVEAADRMHMPKVRLNQLIRGNRGVTRAGVLGTGILRGSSRRDRSGDAQRSAVRRAVSARPSATGP